MAQEGVSERPIRVGISTCLLGERVRFDGGHKKDAYVTDLLGRFFEWVPVCPEVEVGMGVPREAVRLVGDPESPRMVGVKSGTDWTRKMSEYSVRRARELGELNGYLFKSRSPSCGMERVRVYSGDVPAARGRGLYADAFLKRHPLVPAEEEGRLNDARIRENFIVRVFSHHRLQGLGDRFRRSALVEFHTRHQYLLLAHSPRHYRELGRLVATPDRYAPGELRERYAALFMEALKVKATTRKNVNVLQHMLGFLRKRLSALEKEDVLQAIGDYRRELVPLVVPLTLIAHFVRKLEVDYLRDQIYLNPHPKEMMLRNHV
jgi:uncharacterized protein YbgA (DUF1722 family)/uncharacterized protein YbbK (DUF523 family)